MMAFGNGEVELLESDGGWYRSNNGCVSQGGILYSAACNSDY